MSRQRIALLAGGFVLIAALCLLAGLLMPLLLGTADPDYETVSRSCQPADIDYESFDPYCVSVVIESRALQEDDAAIWVAQEQFTLEGRDSGGYGHRIEHIYPPGLYQLEPTATEWTADGLTLTFTLGHELFIPADMFTGGR
jgi:hypothetical protein